MSKNDMGILTSRRFHDVKHEEEKKWQQFYDNHLDYYNKSVWLNCSFTSKSFDELMHKINMKADAGKIVLDIGCGTGETAVHMVKKYKWLTYGIDYSMKRIEAAKALAAKEKVFYSCDFIQADLNIILDKITTRFDMIIGIDIFEHLKYPEEVVAKSKKLLKSNGILLGSIPIEPKNTGEGRHMSPFKSEGQIIEQLKVECPKNLQGHTRANQITFIYRVSNE